MTYWAINAVFLAIVAGKAVWSVALVRRGRRAPISWLAIAVTTVILLVMTAVFDNVMIGVGLVGYDLAHISGVFIGVAPIEDFAYAIAAAVLLPSLWVTLGPGLPREADAATDVQHENVAAPRGVTAGPGRETSA